MSLAFNRVILWEDFIVEKCCKCGVQWAMTKNYIRNLRKHKTTFYCPASHPQVYRESNEDKLRRECDLLKQQLAQLDDEVAEQKSLRSAADRLRYAAEHKAALAKKRVVKLKARASAGVCPCCNRTFSGLQRHMAQKHPQFKAEEV